MKKLLVTTAILAALSTSAYASWEPRFVLMGGQVWNGTSSTFVANFADKPTCEAAFEAYRKDGHAKIANARPKLIGEGIYPVFWHVCSALSPLPS